MNAVVDRLLAVLGLEAADVSRSAVLPDSWGFCSAPSLQQLTRTADSQRRVSADNAVRVLDAPSDAESDGYVSILQSSPSFVSNHCVHAMSEAYGLTQFTNSLCGSLLAGSNQQIAAAAAVHAIKQQVDGAWSAEAVRRGVACAKSGVGSNSRSS